jgi:ADP-ribose pyrophosphatase
MKQEKTLSSKMVFNGRAVNLRVDTVQMPDGRQTTREIVQHADCIAAVVVDDKDNILLVSQYREAVEKELLEIVAGGIEPGEDVETAVKRETQEETGYLPRKLVRLGGFYSAPGYATEYLHLYLATDLIPNRLVAEDTEGIRVVKVSVSQVRKMLADDTIFDAKSIAGLHMYLEYKKNKAKSQ